MTCQRTVSYFVNVATPQARFLLFVTYLINRPHSDRTTQQVSGRGEDEGEERKEKFSCVSLLVVKGLFHPTDF